LDPILALTGFNKHNYELLAGAAAQAHYVYINKMQNVNGDMSFPAENWGTHLNLVNDENFFNSDPRSDETLWFFLCETGALGDWITLLNHFKMLPFWYFPHFKTHEQRVLYLRKLWREAVLLVKEKWEEIDIIAKALGEHKSLLGDDVLNLLR
jgi:hypothetical protein